jgi:hypothetical protein
VKATELERTSATRMRMLCAVKATELERVGATRMLCALKATELERTTATRMRMLCCAVETTELEHMSATRTTMLRAVKATELERVYAREGLRDAVVLRTMEAGKERARGSARGKGVAGYGIEPSSKTPVSRMV